MIIPHANTVEKLAALFVLFLACTTPLLSQKVGIGTLSPLTLLHVDAGESATHGFLFQGNYQAGATVPDLYGSSRLTFFPGKGAFRAGRVTGVQWNNDNTGYYSSAFGVNTIASSDYSFAGGYGTLASGAASFSFGSENQAIGSNSLALGYSNRASGWMSSVLGFYNISKGFSSTVIGVYNDSILVTNENFFNPATPLFIIGNGISEGNRKNALVVRHDGHVGIGTNTPGTFLHVDVGAKIHDGMIVEGDWDLSATVPNLGSGNRMTYHPGKGAFKAGGVFGNKWDDINTGEYSISLGVSNASFGDFSFAAGSNSHAGGEWSSVIGQNCAAFGDASIAFGTETRARGNRSTSFGFKTISKSYGEFVIGRFNDTLLATQINSLTWEDNDALFVAGNGNSEGLRNNALVIYKNGNTDIDGYTQLGSNSPSIKMKKLTGTSSATQNTWVNIAHGLTLSKIISVNIIMNIPGFVNIPPSYTFHTGYQYDYQISPTNIVVLNSPTNSSNILSKAFTVHIVYEE